MATTAPPAETNSKTVDSTLWWDSFATLLSELENVPVTEDLPPKLLEKVKDNHEWLLDTVTRFKPPSQSSKEALKAQKVKIGSHELKVQPELRDMALQISELLCLDEVQSYILVERSADQGNESVYSAGEEFIHLVLLQYYMERQCLLKCVRQILFYSLYAGLDSNNANGIKIEAQRFISDGLENKYLFILQNVMSCNYPENLDVDLFNLWAEEMLIEATLVLDTLFCAYYESLCKITSEKWIRFCSLYKGVLSGSYNLGRLAVSAEAVGSISYAKFQLLLILVETLNLENLLQMVHDEMLFRQDSSSFSLTDILEMDNLISSFSVYDIKEAGPLYLTWAVFLCLVLSLPGLKDNDQLEIDHVGYVRQAIEVGSLEYFLEALQSDILRNSDGLVAGYRSVLRTLVSAFIACYEINLELEDNTLQLILNILCNVYRGEESLCNQFWDRNSIVDGPVRCLLCNLEGEFPFRIVELVRLLSSLSEGAWPADCVYNFLDKSVGISTLLEVKNGTMVDDISQTVESQNPLDVPGIGGLCVPKNTRGHILKMIDDNKALVRWEYAQSGVLVLILRLAQELYTENNEEVYAILDLLCRLTTFNKGISYALMNIRNSMHPQSTVMHGRAENDVWCQIDFVEIICNLNRSLPLSLSSIRMMALSINILATLLKSSPAHVTAVALKTNFFDVSFTNSTHDVGFKGSSREPWLLSGKLAKMLLLESEQSDNHCSLTISVLDLTLQLLDTGLECEVVHSLVVFSLQYVFLNHGHWKYKVNHVRWTVTLKVLEMIKKCLVLFPQTRKISEAVIDMVLHDSSIHKTLLQIICTSPDTLENLYVSRLYDNAEIEGLELAISSVLDVIFIILSKYSEDLSPRTLVFCQVLLSSTVKPVPVVTAVLSLVSYFRKTAIQVAAARVLCSLFSIADYSLQYFPGHSCLEFDDKQITMFRHSMNKILWKETMWSESLFIASIRALTSAACYQPAFLVSVISSKESDDAHLRNSGASKRAVIDGLLQYIEKSDDLMNRDPRTLLVILNFLRELWRGAAQYADILQSIKKSTSLWKHLSTCLSPVNSGKVDHYANVDDLVVYKYQCQCVVMEIMACDMFQQKRLHEAQNFKLIFESSTNEKIEHSTGITDILLSLPENSTFGNLIKSSASCEYKHPVFTHAKVATSLLCVHVMANLERGDSGSLAVSLIEKIKVMCKKLSSLTAFHGLLTQYSKHHYSEEKELRYLIFCDMYHHLQGELEGRNITSGPFKELSQFLLASKFLLSYHLHKNDEDMQLYAKDLPLVDTERLKAHLGLEMWDQSTWKASKSIAEQMLSYLQEANSMVLRSASRISMLKALQRVLAMYKQTNTEKMTPTTRLISEEVAVSCIDHICHCFQGTLDSIDPVLDAREDILDFLGAQIELLLILIRYAPENLPPAVCVMLIKTSTVGLKLSNEFRVAGSDRVKKLLLMLVLSSVELSCQNLSYFENSEATPVEEFAEVSHACLPLLPVLCKCVESADSCILSLTTMDIVLRYFVTAKTWFPILKRELVLTQVMTILFDKNSPDSIPVILKFLLTLARTRGGAEMLLTVGFFSSFRTLFGDLSDGMPFSYTRTDKSLLKSFDMSKQPYSKWGLGLAVLTASICSFGDASPQVDLLENVIYNLFSEKRHIIKNNLRAPDFPSDDHDKKRARAQRMPVSLACLRDMEQTLLLMCALVKHWHSWTKVMKDVNSDLRERSIHLLAYISRGTQRVGESAGRVPPLLCPPVTKDEVDLNNKPSFIKSRNGWFALCPLGCVSKPLTNATTDVSTALAVKDKSSGSTNQTRFSDMTAIQLYRIAFLVLKFLCLQAESASKRAQEMGFVDLAHFPELPMPDILHGLQDQVIAIVTELCKSKKPNQFPTDAQNLCLLLLQIMEMGLYLELCVSQICGIKPVLGCVEDFIKSLFKAAEDHSFLNPSIKSVKQIISLSYPEVLQSESYLQLF
ncbi:hypothetical protein QQ045_011911 [Rhodiola kirilowii]